MIEDTQEVEGLAPFFMNSVPKSGTHLLKNILSGIPGVVHDRRNEFYQGYQAQWAQQFYRLGQLKRNEFAAGHVYFSPEWQYMLKRLGIKQLFLYRDLRDIVVSYTYFLVEKYPYHPLSKFLSQELRTKKERHKALILGIRNPGIRYPNIAEWFGQYAGWLKDSASFQIRYEDLVRSRESRLQTLTSMLGFLWDSRTPPTPLGVMLEHMEERSDPRNSLTFRSGKIGNWQHEFDQETAMLFNQVAGDLLIELGYEKDKNWVKNFRD